MLEQLETDELSEKTAKHRGTQNTTLSHLFSLRLCDLSLTAAIDGTGHQSPAELKDALALAGASGYINQGFHS